MAVKAAMEGKKVLVIDCDPQLNSTNFFFGYNNNDYNFDAFYNRLVRFHTLKARPIQQRTAEDNAFMEDFKGVPTPALAQGGIPPQGLQLGASLTWNVYDVIREVIQINGWYGTVMTYPHIGIPIAVPTAFAERGGSIRLLASHPMFGEIETHLANEINSNFTEPDRSFRFRLLVNYLIEKYTLDLVLVDLSPSSSFLNQNIVLSSDYIILPCAADEYAYYSIKTIGLWLRAWHDRHAALQMTPKVLTVVYNKYKRFTHHRDQSMSLVTMEDQRTFHTSEAHKSYIMRLIDPNHGAIHDLVTNNPIFVLPNISYLNIPLICDGLSTSSKLSSFRRTAYDVFTPLYHNSDTKTCKQLRKGYDAVWKLIRATMPVEGELLENEASEEEASEDESMEDDGME
jgi:cellulose biosynthesis protein BcsQ